MSTNQDTHQARNAGARRQTKARDIAHACKAMLHSLVAALGVHLPNTDHIPEPLAGKIRAGQIAAILRLTPVMMIANLLNVGTVDWLFWQSDHQVFLIAWSALTITLAVTGLRSWWRNRPLLQNDGLPRRSRSSKSIRRMIINSAVLALLWSMVPITLFAQAEPGARMFIAVLTSGMMSAGALALSTVPLAALTYTFMLALASAFALISAAEPVLVYIGVILLIYTWILAKTTTWKADMFISRLIDQAQLVKQNELIGLLLRDFEESASDWLWEIDEQGRLQHVSMRLAAMLGQPAAALQNRRFREVFCPHAGHAGTGNLQLVEDLIAKRAPFRDQVVAVTIGGIDGWWSLCGKPVFDETGAYRGYRGVGSDVTQSRRAQERIAQMARFDGLTGLPNRAHFRELLSARIAGEAATSPPALICIDLDQFKSVNDSMGHTVGDRLLVCIAGRLTDTVGDTAIVARLAGDEFAVLPSGPLREEDVVELARKVIAIISLPYQLHGKQVQIGASAGIALTGDGACSPEQLMNNADLALYTAKNEGHGQFRVFGPAIDAEVRKRRTMTEDLQAALKADEFSLHYQPVISACDNSLRGFEALLRWTHPVKGAISPADFIPVAEESGLMDEIGAWVIRTACAEAASWPRAVTLAVNLSPTQFHNAQLLNIILGALGTSGLSPRRLELEITETALLTHSTATVNTLNHLRSIGVRIALDDFGTGYASLSYLRGFPFDRIKIDQSFVRDAIERPDCAAIVKATIGLAASLGMASTAEGVETGAQFDWLRDQGCTDVQGYLFSRPRPAEDLPKMFEQGEKLFADVARKVA
ncbi:EAL domain-containing protein [Breoghania sp. L-A4]|uniref:putative bifunctional diguanylate cyclase/phosphodiesterase n=1 Tax=Breoghania sp. L-A4 TaxID=2304600 RepID=UPI0013C32203|nr:EAL domain-containing protein [Breoghania sp. L-A4]